MSAFSIEQVNALHEAGKFNDASSMCIEMIKAGQNVQEAYILFARSYLFMMMPVNLKDHQDGFLNAVSGAVKLADTPEEVFEIEARCCEFVEMWQGHVTRKILANFAANPTAEQWQAYINTWAEFPKLKLYVNMTVCGLQKVKDMCAAGNYENMGAFAKVYRPDRTPLFTDADRHTLEFQFATSGFERARNYFQANCDTVGDYAINVAKQTIMSLAMLDLAFSTSLKDKELAPQERLRRLIGRSELKYMELAAVVGPIGNQTSIYTNPETRTKMLGELRQLYQEIQNLDPSFVIPMLPSSQPMLAQQQSSGGGCYVATCVYGSYDCPQVWTLRRFRDDTLASTWYGRLFIRTYYAVSPTLVKWFGNTNWFRTFWKGKLDRMVSRLAENGVENTPYEDKAW